MQGQLGPSRVESLRPSSARQCRRPRATLTPQDQRTEDYGRFG